MACLAALSRLLQWVCATASISTAASMHAACRWTVRCLLPGDIALASRAACALASTAAAPFGMMPFQYTCWVPSVAFSWIPSAASNSGHHMPRWYRCAKSLANAPFAVA